MLGFVVLIHGNLAVRPRSSQRSIREPYPVSSEFPLVLRVYLHVPVRPACAVGVCVDAGPKDSLDLGASFPPFFLISIVYPIFSEVTPFLHFV